MSRAVANRRLPPLDLYPERVERPLGWLDEVEATVLGLPTMLRARFGCAHSHRFVTAVNALETHSRGLSDTGIRERAEVLRARLCCDGLEPAAVAASFALVREAARRRIGQRHHDVQLAGGLAMLRGEIAEMDTGEGKTLTATLTAATAALAGIPVHVVTTSDYLAERDARNMGSIYAALGLSVAAINHGSTPAERASVYASDIAYVSNKEIAFDYLRDRITLRGRPRNIAMKLRRVQGLDSMASPVLRGLHFAIVDEADSVLVDEARTPLIISRETPAAEEQAWAETALGLANRLEDKQDYEIVQSERRVVLRRPGRERLAEICEALGGEWRSTVRREEAARQALSALKLFHRGEHYLVRDGKVDIVDEYTGRIMGGRSWSQGLHQLIEVKEGCAVTGRKLPMARMTYQRFFRRYCRLAGMTGTAREVRRELWTVYGLAVRRIPTNVPARRRALTARILGSTEEKWQGIVERAAELSATGCPVLIGTRSVTASETLSRLLAKAGVEHRVLNALQDEREAEIIAEAGRRGRVTVATNMAGRGVDIPLDAEVRAADGLHVILSERHDARRIDRQFEGRCGRQGDPGVTETWLSLNDPLLDLLPARLVGATHRLAPRMRHVAALALFRWAQRRAERAHSAARRELLRQDQQLGTVLAFSGGTE